MRAPTVRDPRFLMRAAALLAAAGAFERPAFARAAGGDGDGDGEAGSAPVEELFAGEMAVPQEPLDLQSTLTLDYRRLARERLAARPQLELGVVDRLQISLEAELVRLPSEGASAASLAPGLLVCIARTAGRGFQLSAGAEASFPVAGGAADDEAAERGFELLTAAYVALDPVHLNVSAALGLDDTTPEGGSAVLGVMLPLATALGRIVPSAEVFVEGDGRGLRWGGLLGLFVRPHPRVEIGVATGFEPGLAPAPTQVLAAVTWELELAERRHDDF